MRNEFTYRIGLLYLDLDELPRLFRRRALWSASRPNLAWFRRSDYLGDPRTPLDVAVRDKVEEQTGRRPIGPIRVLTQLRTFGYLFNPVTFYYCFDATGDEVEVVLAQITNTPWKERHTYVLPRSRGAGPHGLHFALTKQFHVSPFMPMDQSYDWRFTRPGRALSIHMQSEGRDGQPFDATLTLARQSLTRGSLARFLLTHPLQTFKVPVAIYWQALKLWWKGVPFHRHPAKRGAPLQERTR